MKAFLVISILLVACEIHFAANKIVDAIDRNSLLVRGAVESAVCLKVNK